MRGELNAFTKIVLHICDRIRGEAAGESGGIQGDHCTSF